MLPFSLETLDSVPDKFLGVISKMVGHLPVKKGIAFLTIDGKYINAGESHRRGGPHTDGNYLKEGDWGKGKDGGWKVGEMVEHSLLRNIKNPTKMKRVGC